MDWPPPFSVKFSYKGKSITVSKMTHQTTSRELLQSARSNLNVGDNVFLKLLYKGKILGQDEAKPEGTCSCACASPPDDVVAFPLGKIISNGVAKVIVMGTETRGILALNAGRSDPLMRGFDAEDGKQNTKSNTLSPFWGTDGRGNQNPQYKFCRFQECTDASFGSRPGESTPHAFEARRLLERLATDPGIVAIVTSRELIVGTLGEMDPVDDRIMQKMQAKGACLLGYNTNHGMRIDVKLRTDDLSGFRPYSELASTLIHELSHNWVGEHNALFWTNFGQMRVEYLYAHSKLAQARKYVNGKSMAALAGVSHMISQDEGGEGGGTPDVICASVLVECAKDMAQHGIPVQVVAPAILTFAKEQQAEAAAVDDARGRKLGSTDDGKGQDNRTARERALAAAEKRAKESVEKKS